MGLFRGTLVLFLTALLFIALFAVNLFLTFSWSLDYAHAETYLKSITSDNTLNSGESGRLLQEYENKKNMCLVNNAANFSFSGETIEVPCEVINKGEKIFLDYVINESAPKFYYKDYNCSFFDCIKTEEEPFVLVSENAKNYWAENLKFAILISVVIFVLILLFTKRKYNAFILAGIIMAFSSLPFRQIEGVLGLFPEFLPFKILPVFFSESYKVFMLSLILGILLIAFGIGFQLFKWGEKLDKWIDSGISKINRRKDEKNEITKEEVKEIIKEEVKEEIEKEKTEKEKVEKEAKKSKAKKKIK